MAGAKRLTVRIAALAIALAGSAAAMASGLDRAGVPGPWPAFRSNAQVVAALHWLTVRQSAHALAAATAAVRADPLNVGASSALGTARLAADDPRGAAAAFRVAGQLGWRDRQTQLYWVLMGNQVGDYQVSAERADALLRQDASLLTQPALLPGLLAAPGGRRALAARLALRPSWFQPFLGALYMLSKPDLVARARVLDEPALASPVVRCNDVGVMVAALNSNGEGDRGRAILRRFCGSGGGFLADGGFARASLTNSTPQGWQFVGVGGLDIRLGPGPGFAYRAVRIDNALPSRQAFASQQLQLAQGDYMLSWRAHDEDGAPSGRVLAAVTCTGGAGVAQEPKTVGDRTAMRVAVPAGCPLQTLTLSVTSGSGAVFVDDVAVAAEL